MKIKTITHQNVVNRPLRILEADAYHQAGQAVAISLGNQLKRLPAVHFQICLYPCKIETDERFPSSEKNYTLTLEGGRLIQSLPLCFAEAENPQYCLEQADNRHALEADIMNMLAGPLAEAKYHAVQQGKSLNPSSSFFKTLRFYNKSPFNRPVDEYLECFFPRHIDRQHKLIELLQASFHFINDSAIWEKIKALAAYIVAHPKAIIDCEEIFFFLTSWQKSTCIPSCDSSLMACN
jgi:hypothetical protein